MIVKLCTKTMDHYHGMSLVAIWDIVEIYSSMSWDIAGYNSDEIVDIIGKSSINVDSAETIGTIVGRSWSMCV